MAAKRFAARQRWLRSAILSASFLSFIPAVFLAKDHFPATNSTTAAVAPQQQTLSPSTSTTSRRSSRDDDNDYYEYRGYSAPSQPSTTIPSQSARTVPHTRSHAS